MVKFKNKKTGKITEEHLMFYVNRMRNNPSFAEIKEKEPKEGKSTPKEEKAQEVANKPQ